MLHICFFYTLKIYHNEVIMGYLIRRVNKWTEIIKCRWRGGMEGKNEPDDEEQCGAFGAVD